MQKYIAHMKEKSPHERRVEAVRVSAMITGVLFLGWLATLGLRLASPSAATAAKSDSSNIQAQLAAIAQSVSPQQAGKNGQATSNYLETADTPAAGQTLNN